MQFANLGSKSPSPFTSSTSTPPSEGDGDADNEASDTDAHTETETDRDADLDSISDRRNASVSSLSTTSVSQEPSQASTLASRSVSPAPSSVLLPHAYSIPAAYRRHNTSPTVITTTYLAPRENYSAPSFTRTTSTTSASSYKSSPTDSLPFPFSFPKPDEAINFAPENPMRSRLGLSATGFRTRTGTWKAARDRARSPSEESTLQRLASRCGHLSRKLTSVAAGSHR